MNHFPFSVGILENSQLPKSTKLVESMLINSMLPPGFEPESKPREGSMIGRYTTGAKNIFYPPDAT